MEATLTGIKFDIEAFTSGDIECGEIFRGEAVQVDGYRGSIKKTQPVRLKVMPEFYALLIVRQGTQLLWAEADRRWYVIPPGSLAYIRGPMAVTMSFARGDHHFETVAWPGRAASFLSDWLERFRPKGSKGDRPRPFVTLPIHPNFQAVVGRFDAALAGNPELVEPLVFSVLYEVLPRMIRSRSRMGLAPIPADLPPNMVSLVKQVREKPDIAWPLKEAADIVGYSPFHFSRVYKQIMGYGFHEFVDRCRTEHAVEMLCTSDAPIDVVAAASGFGTTQALRESVKEYLGLVPSELRANPEELAGIR